DAVAVYSIEYDLSRALILAMIYEESDPKWDPDCVSFKGARGLMQIMPLWDDTLIKEGIIETPEQIFDIARNIRAGCWILRDYLDIATGGLEYYGYSDFRRTALESALDAYSGGGGQVYIGKVRDTMARITKFMEE
ncbi:MAG: transglycosylase SLT domain-containing protein, partial [Candidatus Mariimomonas ferrooxydans]